MKILKRSHDGGKDSGVTGFWLVECKSLFSVVLLKFNTGSREAYHSHAFNALTWWLKGEVTEHYLDVQETRDWRPSLIPKLTKKNCFHKIVAKRPSWALSIRGPWDKTWKENKQGNTYTLTHGRKVVDNEVKVGVDMYLP